MKEKAREAHSVSDGSWNGEQGSKQANVHMY